MPLLPAKGARGIPGTGATTLPRRLAHRHIGPASLRPPAQQEVEGCNPRRSYISVEKRLPGAQRARAASLDSYEICDHSNLSLHRVHSQDSSHLYLYYIVRGGSFSLSGSLLSLRSDHFSPSGTSNPNPARIFQADRAHGIPLATNFDECTSIGVHVHRIYLILYIHPSRKLAYAWYWLLQLAVFFFFIFHTDHPLFTNSAGTRWYVKFIQGS